MKTIEIVRLRSIIKALLDDMDTSNEQDVKEHLVGAIIGIRDVLEQQKLITKESFMHIIM